MWQEESFLPVLASQRKPGMVGGAIQKSVGRLYLFLLRGLAAGTEEIILSASRN